MFPERVLTINRDLKRAQILQDPPCMETDSQRVIDKQRG
jgi:hypothetical protein